MMKILKLLLLFFFILSCSSGAFEIQISAFLATAENDYLLPYQNEKIHFLNSSSSNTPFLDRVEFRTESDEFEINRQRYSVRLYPNGWGETEAGKKIYDVTLQFNKTQYDLLFHQALKKRYTLIVDFLHTGTMIELHKKLMVLYEDRVTAFKKNINSLDFDINDLIEAEDALINLKLELMDMESMKRGIEDVIRVRLNAKESIKFDTDKIIGISFIEKNLYQFNRTPDMDNVYLRNSSLSLELARSRYNLEKSENKRFISFFEASYDNEQRYDSEEAFSLQLGVNLPFINSNRLEINRRKLRYLAEKGENENLKARLSENLQIVTNVLKSFIRKHKVLLKKKENDHIESSIKTYSQIEGLNPMILLKIKESSLKRDIALERIKYEIFKKYIELLDVTGRLSDKPLKNYISMDLEEVTTCKGEMK
ncbi:MAG: hypothetical protein SV062_02405 [Thermodesulfobacteriota bacterium]|nr:hypothetical protein [Thermodesulfobacteriota bacterium]